MHDESKVSKTDSMVRGCCKCGFARFGMIFAVSWSIVALALGLLFWLSRSESSVGLSSWFGSILQLYVNWFLVVLGTSFLPSERASKCLCCCNRMISCATCCFIPNLFGTWFIERAKVHRIIRKSIESRGERGSLSLTADAIELAHLRLSAGPVNKDGRLSHQHFHDKL